MVLFDQENRVAPRDIKDAPVSVTITDVNSTGDWKFVRPCLKEKIAPCQAACPLFNEVPTYLELIKRNNLEEAFRVLRKNNPLPATTGRVCPAFCQHNCNRQNLDQEVSIASIEAYLGDWGMEIRFPRPQRIYNYEVAVIGSGPAGLAAAYFLSRYGLKVNIMEKEPEPGGLLRYGIPGYRLSKDILAREIDNLIKSFSIGLKCNTEIDRHDIQDLLREYDFVFCAPGLGETFIPNEFKNKSNIKKGLEFLKSINKSSEIQGDRFIIIGGGNVAVDVARSLVRAGKKAEIIYRRSFKDMPAYKQEKAQALKEGVLVREDCLVSHVDYKDEFLKLSIHQSKRTDKGIELGDFLEYRLADQVILATGQKEHLNLPVHPRLFQGGDLKTGPASVVEAMATGKEAAKKILDKIEIEHDIDIPSQQELESSKPQLDRFLLPSQTKEEGLADLDNLTPDCQMIVRQAFSCLHCGTCNGCGLCSFFCPDMAIKLGNESDRKTIIFDLYHCKGCGLCAAECPRGVIEMEEDIS